jgi:amino acid transporter
VAFAFTGFKHGVELAGETRNSQVAVPLGIVGSVVCCLLLYLGLQIAFIGALPASVLSHGWTHLTFNVDVAPFMGIAMLLGLALLAKLLYIDAAVSPLGAGLVYVTSTARLIYAMSKNGYLPAFLSRLNKEDFPIFAIGFNFLVGMGLFLPLPGWQNMVSFLVSAVVIAYAMGPIALMSLRAQLPNEHRPFRLWCAPVTSLIAFYFCNLISYWTGWETIEKLAIAMAVGFLLFSLSIVRQWHDHFRFNWKALIWIMPYLAGLILISYCGSFGGKGYLTFGWDFLVIAIFSVIIFYLAYLTRLRDSQAEFQNYKNTEFAP